MNLADPITLRDAALSDLPALTAIRSSAAHHRGRLRDAAHPDFRYLVILHGLTIVGFVCLVFRRPASWLNADDTQHLPQIVDLHIEESWRGRGYGSAAVRLIEHIVLQLDYHKVYIAVEPQNNPRAYALYQRLGYQALQLQPYHHVWAAIDGDGNTDRGEAWLVDMEKRVQPYHIG